MVKEEIKKILQRATGETDVTVEIPADNKFGDYSSNIALVLAKKTGKSPRQVADEIIEKFNSKVLKNLRIEKVEVAGQGFINFYLSKEFFIEEIKNIDKNFGTGRHAKGYKVIVEHTQPNPFKEFHIGHLMNNAIGESVARIIAANGATVKTASYHGDVGLHVAKTIWGKAQNPNTSWQDAYVAGSAAYEENEQAKQQITALNKEIYDRSDESINTMYDEGKKESFERFRKMYKKLDSTFDYHFYESDAGEVGKKLVLENLGKIFTKGENGALVFRGEDFEPKTHTRVFINAQGFPTYEGKEIGLAFLKKVWNYDKALTITANEQDSFFNVVEVAIGQVFPKAKGKLHHLSHGILKLPTGKMSSRTGNVITAEALIEKVKETVKEKSQGRGLSDEDMEKIAIGAIKYSILKQSIGGDIIFDFEKSVSFEGDSGPYLQYAYVRAISVLEKAKDEGVKASFKKTPEEIGMLEKMMVRFPEIAEKAGQAYEPHVIVLYLTELAREFNNYYARAKIVDKDDELSPYRVALTQAFSTIIKNGLWLLGIAVPEKM